MTTPMPMGLNSPDREHSIVFRDNDVEFGRLIMGRDGTIYFDGTVDRSAAIFFDNVVKANNNKIFELETTIANMDVSYYEMQMSSLSNQIANLLHSRRLCHKYAGCKPGVCELDGDECPEQRV